MQLDARDRLRRGGSEHPTQDEPVTAAKKTRKARRTKAPVEKTGKTATRVRPVAEPAAVVEASVSKPAPPLASDILWGAQAIAREINREVQITYYMLQRGQIPATKIGETWTTTRTRLRDHFNGG